MDLKGTYRVYSRYVRMLGLRVNARGPWFQLSNIRKTVPLVLRGYGGT